MFCKLLFVVVVVDLFERRRKYNVPVYMCVHPELNQYIRDVLVGVKGLLGRGLVDKLVVAIKNKVRASYQIRL